MKQSTTEQPMRFTDMLDPRMRGWAWLPAGMVTLCWWPMGQGYTVFEVKRCKQSGLMAYNVALVTTIQEKGEGA